MEPFPVAKKEPNGNASSKAAATLAALTGPQAVDMSLARCKTLEKHEMDHWLLPQTRRRINSGMTQREFPLVADTVTDFILYPTSDELRLSPDDPLVLAKERRIVGIYFDVLRAILVKHGHAITLNRIDHHSAIGWLIHYRARDPVTITMLHDIAAGDPGPSDPAELGLLVAQVAAGEWQSV